MFYGFIEVRGRCLSIIGGNLNLLPCKCAMRGILYRTRGGGSRPPAEIENRPPPPLPPARVLPNLARHAICPGISKMSVSRGHPLRRVCSTSTWIRPWLSRASDASAANKEIERERERAKKNFPFTSPRGRFQPRVGAPAQLTPPLATGG